MSFTPKAYSKPQTVTTSGTKSTKPVDDGKKKSLLKDNSWIRTNVNEEEQIEQGTNFGKTVLNRYKSNENLVSPQDKTSKSESKTTTVTTSSGTSVQALTKRFGGSQDHLNEIRTTGTKTTVKAEPRKSSTTTTTTTTLKDGAKITESTVTTTKQDVVKSSTKSETLSDKDLANLNTKSSSGFKTEVVTVKSSKDTVDGPTSPVKTTTSIKTYTKEDVSPTKTTTSVKSTKSTEDQLFDTLIPTSIKSANTKPNSSEYKTEVVTVKTSREIIDVPTSPVKTTTSIKTYTKEDVSPPKTTSFSTKSDYKTEVVTVKSSKEIIDVPTSPVKTTTSIKTYTKEDVSPPKTTSFSTKRRSLMCQLLLSRPPRASKPTPRRMFHPLKQQHILSSPQRALRINCLILSYLRQSSPPTQKLTAAAKMYRSPNPPEPCIQQVREMIGLQPQVLLTPERHTQRAGLLITYLTRSHQKPLQLCTHHQKGL